MTRPHHFTRKQKAQLHLRCGGKCDGCGAKLKTGEGDADHILPVELGGESSLDNGQILCRVCHAGKTGNDIRRMRKAERQRDKHTGAFAKKGPGIQNRGFAKAGPQQRASRPVNKWYGWSNSDDMA